jgi:hypothetical protein
MLFMRHDRLFEQYIFWDVGTPWGDLPCHKRRREKYGMGNNAIYEATQSAIMRQNLDDYAMDET